MSTNGGPLGKFGEERLKKYVFPYLGRARSEGMVSRYGSDYNALSLDDDRVLVASTDPLAVSPQLGWERSGRLALQVITTDVAVSGISPSHLLANWNLPPSTSDETFEEIWRGFTDEAEKNEVTVFGGHTGRYDGSCFPTVGAGTALGLGSKEDLLPEDFSPGDRIYLLNRLGLEAGAIFAFYYPDRLTRETSESTVEDVKLAFDDLNPTGDLDFLASLPGLRLLHDIAEGGLLGGLQEMLSDRETGAKVDLEEVTVDRNVSLICRRLDLDPLRITSVGSGLAIVSSSDNETFRRTAKRESLPVREIGEITEGKDLSLHTSSGVKILERPIQDEFWTRLSEFSE